MATYRTIRPLVAHGRCSVFECEREDDGKIFVRKRLSHDTDGVAAARFEREIRLASLVSHPNIVKVIEADPDPKPTWFVMPKYECSLADRLNDVRGDRTLVDPIFTCVLRGVAYLHWHWIVHRDLKPENVLMNKPSHPPGDGAGKLESEPDLVVADFGISRQMDSAMRLTLSGQRLGTDYYMAPEVRTLGGTQADRRSDIFALGGILHALYTGLPSPDWDDSRDEPALPFEILRVVTKARYWKPNSRYQTVPELQRAWRLAATANLGRTFAPDSPNQFGDHLLQDGAPVEDVDRMVTLVRRSLPTSQQVYETIMQVKAATMGIVARQNPVLARCLIRAFVDHIEADDGAFPNTSAVVRCYEALGRHVDDPACRGALAAGLLALGYQRNDRSAISSFASLVSEAADNEQLSPIRAALLDLDPERVMRAKHELEPTWLTEPVRELFSSL